MSELQNPIFDEEKEFLERKKLEYERALRGDVDEIKEKSVAVGKVALVGAGLAGGIWLLTKAFGGKKRKKKAARRKEQNRYEQEEHYADQDRDDERYEDYDSSNDIYFEGEESVKSAADSASVFEAHHEQQAETEDRNNDYATSQAMPQPAAFADQDAKADPFEELPYDDSRRLDMQSSFDKDDEPDYSDDHGHDEEPHAAARKNSRSRMVGAVLQSFLQSDTGKVLVAQAGAVALALVTKKIGEFFPANKNSDLADSPAPATAENGASPVASSAPTDSPDASNNPQYL